MAKGLCGRRREKKQEVLDGSWVTLPTYNWTREAMETSTTLWILDELEHMYCLSLQ